MGYRTTGTLVLGTAQSVPLPIFKPGNSLSFWELAPVSRDAFVDVRFHEPTNPALRMRFRDIIREKFERFYLEWTAQTGFTAALVVGSECFGLKSGAIADLLDDGADGNYEVITFADPAAGAEFSYTVPAGERFEIIALRIRLTTAVAVANRAVHLRFRDASANVIYGSVSNVNQTASFIGEYNFGSGLGTVGELSTQEFEAYGPMPKGFIMLPGWTIVTVTSNIQAADQWNGTTSFALVRRF